MENQNRKFTAETGQLLKLMISSIYTNKETSIRELISNASDAIDKLKYLILTNKIQVSNYEPKIIVSVDKENKKIVIEDNGIGMDEDDLISNLGTIAKSGTKEFLESISKDSNLIGQFGVGFYSGFIIADSIEVISKKARQSKVYRWFSTGIDSYEINEHEDKFNFQNTPDEQSGRTSITLHIKDEEFLDHFKIKNIIKTYSDNILYPIFYYDLASKQMNQINKGLAIWTKLKSEVSEKEYEDFYKSISLQNDKPLAILHNRNEGRVEFTNLLFIPGSKTYDTHHPDRISRIKLYVNRVFITDQNLDLVPKYLRFLRGVIDCSSLPLNISRETIQNNPLISLIKDIIEKKVLSKIQDMKKNDHESYVKFYDCFAEIFKEGLCERAASHEDLLKVCSFYSAKHNRMMDCDEYIELDTKSRSETEERPKRIYYLIGSRENKDYLMRSSHIEGLMDKGLDVLIMTDEIDNYWTSIVRNYRDYELLSATEAGLDSTKTEEKLSICKYFEDVLKNYNVDVKISPSLKSSPARLVDPEGINMRMEKFLVRNHQLSDFGKKSMEINLNHPQVKKIEEFSKNLEDKNFSPDKEEQTFIESLTKMMFFNACIMEDYPVNKLEFDKILNFLISKV